MKKSHSSDLQVELFDLSTGDIDVISLDKLKMLLEHGNSIVLSNLQVSLLDISSGKSNTVSLLLLSRLIKLPRKEIISVNSILITVVHFERITPQCDPVEPALQFISATQVVPSSKIILITLSSPILSTNECVDSDLIQITYSSDKQNHFFLQLLYPTSISTIQLSIFLDNTLISSSTIQNEPNIQLPLLTDMFSFRLCYSNSIYALSLFFS